MRTLAVACAGILGMGGLSAVSAAGPCTVLTDPAADVQAVPGTGLPDSHLDVTAVTVARSGTDLVFTIRDTGLDEARKGEWRVTFASGRRALFVSAGLGMWVNAGDYTGPVGFHAGIQGRRAVAVRGSFDYTASEIRVYVPLSTLGLSPRAPLAGFAVESREVFANVAPMGTNVAWVALSDQGRSERSYVVGTAC